MCGIVGAVSSRNIVPGPGRGPAAARIPRLRLLRRRRAPGRPAAPRAQHGARRRAAARTSPPTTSKAAPASPTRAGPRTARRRAQRASALLARPGRRRRRRRRGLGHGRVGPHRARAQRHHREPRRAARRAEGQGLRLRDARPTPRSSPTSSTTSTTATCSTPCSAPLPRLRGAYAIAVFCRDEPHRVVGARARLAAGARRRQRAGANENFLASDAMALAGVTDQIVYLEEGDVVDLQLGKYWISARRRRTARSRRVAARGAHRASRTPAPPSSGPYRHYMQKEIFEQPSAIADTLDARARHHRPSCSATAPTASSRTSTRC